MIKQLLAFALVCWTIIYGYNRLTDGYSLSQMRSQIVSHHPSPPLTEQKKASIKALLDQPFTYLGKGCQFYAFGSADGKYVLKFLKQKHLRELTPFHKKSNAERKERVEKLFDSVQLAYSKMPQESGLLYIHLNREPVLDLKVTLIDKVGVRRKVQLDDYEFVLQERALSVKEVFQQIGSEEEAKRRIGQLVKLVEARCAKGIRDRDRSFVQNVAFSKDGEHALFVDVGQLYEDPTILEPQEQAEDIKKRMGNLKHFLEKYQMSHFIHHLPHHQS